MSDVLDDAPSCCTSLMEIDTLIGEGRLDHTLESTQTLLKHEKELIGRV